ncbi:hypothetical protein [Polynucleobacter necessarius]|uniref:hypothetical protein n=1 Tax=Polynucleobacter necessarius TaxID=576610 RepID=UPI0013B04DDC|nr:hypothetical protein [Polynucleobacter necessarius]
MHIEVRQTLIVKTQADGRSSVDLMWLSRLLREIGRGCSLVVASQKSGTPYMGVLGAS